MTYFPVDIEKAVVKEASRRRYSIRTIETYISCIRKFLSFCNKDIRYISKKDAKDFLEYLDDRGMSGNTMNVFHMSIKFLMEDTLRKNIRLNIKYSKVPEKLPVFLTKEEMKSLLGKIKNWKHRLMIEVLYGGGLRVSELINLKINDLMLEKNYGFIRHGKGNKDRIFIIAKICSEKVKNIIEIEKLNSEDYLFKSRLNKKYSDETIREIIKKAVKKTDIKKSTGCHTLRHSFATHLIEQGQSISEVQSLLGHKSPETTQIYLHTATSKIINVKSPLDNI